MISVPCHSTATRSWRKNDIPIICFCASFGHQSPLRPVSVRQPAGAADPWSDAGMASALHQGRLREGGRRLGRSGETGSGRGRARSDFLSKRRGSAPAGRLKVRWNWGRCMRLVTGRHTHCTGRRHRVNAVHRSPRRKRLQGKGFVQHGTKASAPEWRRGKKEWQKRRRPPGAVPARFVGTFRAATKSTSVKSAIRASAKSFMLRITMADAPAKRATSARPRRDTGEGVPTASDRTLCPLPLARVRDGRSP